jgi:hypothetical protein
MSLAQRRGGNRSVIPDTTLREAEMSTTPQHTSIPGTAVEYQLDGQPTKVYNAGEALTDPAVVVTALSRPRAGNAQKGVL